MNELEQSTGLTRKKLEELVVTAKAIAQQAKNLGAKDVYIKPEGQIANGADITITIHNKANWVDDDPTATILIQQEEKEWVFVSGIGMYEFWQKTSHTKDEFGETDVWTECEAGIKVRTFKPAGQAPWVATRADIERWHELQHVALAQVMWNLV